MNNIYICIDTDYDILALNFLYHGIDNIIKKGKRYRIEKSVIRGGEYLIHFYNTSEAYNNETYICTISEEILNKCFESNRKRKIRNFLEKNYELL